MNKYKKMREALKKGKDRLYFGVIRTKTKCLTASLLCELDKSKGIIMEVKGMNTQEAIEFVENILKNNPYPEDVFTPIPKEDYDKINNLLKKKMGYPIDRLFGNMGRKIYMTIGEYLKQIIPLLKQGDEQNKKHIEWLKNYLYQLYKDEVITSDQLYDISEIFSIKDGYEYSR